MGGAQRDYLKIFSSNLKLAGATLLFSYRYPYRFFAERQNNNMGSLSYEPRGNLSEFNRLIICAIPQYIKSISALERLFPRVICPFCPVIFVLESYNSLKGKTLASVLFKTLDKTPITEYR